MKVEKNLESLNCIKKKKNLLKMVNSQNEEHEGLIRKGKFKQRRSGAKLERDNYKEEQKQGKPL